MLPAPLQSARPDKPRWITPEPLNVAPALVGLPLAHPGRRALAMGLDLILLALLSGVSGFWLLGGLGCAGAAGFSRGAHGLDPA